LIEDVERALHESKLSPDLLELEITENIALNHEDAAEPLRTLRQRGVKIAFDDFGTGYASLSCLTMFPVSRIKIDRGFVSRIANSAQDAAIIRSLITMAKSLNLEVIAEGVETAAQAAFLHNERCEEGQGFLYGKPLSAEEFGAYLSVARIADPGASDDVAVTSPGNVQAAAG
jgi:EAL domain-containing protein (putative c-di-GMP-specific phosphodiesterase class I)